MQVLLYRHAKTGAQLISVSNSDENKTFGVTFRTPVANSKVGGMRSGRGAGMEPPAGGDGAGRGAPRTSRRGGIN